MTVLIHEENFRANLARVRERIASVCEAVGRAAGDVTLLPVTKSWPAEIARMAFRAGFGVVGDQPADGSAPVVPDQAYTAQAKVIVDQFEDVFRNRPFIIPPLGSCRVTQAAKIRSNNMEMFR